MADFYSPDELADYLGVPVSTVYGWRTKGIGPVGIRVGRHVRYPRHAVESWLAEQLDAARTA